MLPFRSASLNLAVLAGLTAPAQADDTSLSALKERVVGSWTSIACELRPQANPEDPTRAPLPTYLTRDFTYDAEDGFDATITVFADPECAVPLISYDLAGHIVWHDANPAAEGAWSQDYVLDDALQLTVLAPSMADQLNTLPEGACGEGPFMVGQVRDILRQPCALLRFVDKSEVVVDHDLLLVRADTPNMLFMGAKHVDGTGFYFPENRPIVGLQQPLIRVE
ncbi:MAG: hypothetical protein AAFU80_07810 [Pseudomonadota bacterium]